MLSIRHKAIIVLSSYLISVGILLAYFSPTIATFTPPVGYFIHATMTLFATFLLSIILTGNGINDLDYKLMFILFLFYEIFGLFTSQSVTLQGELVTANPLWCMTLDSLIGYVLQGILPNVMIVFFGSNISVIYLITYIVSPTILVISLILLLEKSELRKLFSKLF